MKRVTITPQFVELMPGQLQEGVLYISEKYCTAIHKCCCGCGQKVVTPLSPAKWQLRRDEDAVTLYPSIGNWSFPCQSHYWIQRNRVEWAGSMSKQRIRRVQERDQRDSNRYIEQSNTLKASKNVSQSAPSMTSGEIKSGQYTLWSLLKDWWNRRKP
jgi:hypothetical protein